MDDVVIGGCLGRSDNKMVEFKILGDMRKTVSSVTTLDFGKADFSSLRN